MDIWQKLEDYESRLESKVITAADLPDIKQCFSRISEVDSNLRGEFGRRLNEVKQVSESLVQSSSSVTTEKNDVDIHAPFGPNSQMKTSLPTDISQGVIHPISKEIEKVASIFARLGFNIETSREIDDDYHMFESLNFSVGHPARDDWDTFQVEGGLVAPAHTSTMQNRIIKAGVPTKSIVIDRVFRNEDIDARHEHTLHQAEGILVDKNINIGNLLATLQEFLQLYFETDIEFKTQPAYFPFVEPGLEYSLSCPFCQKRGCKVCSHEGWIELLGCGMIHPNVLKMAGVDHQKYSGFAWGMGIDRLLMIRRGINEIRSFQSGSLEFLDNFTMEKS